MATKKEKVPREDFSSKISGEINCSICLDILVNPLTLVPCGHSFCTSCCLADSVTSGRRRKSLCFAKCPQCRQPIKETVRSRQLESLIDTLVTVPNLLFQKEDDKKEYLKRKKVENDRSQILPIPSKTKKRRRQEHFPSNYNGYALSAPAEAARVANPYHHGSSNHHHSRHEVSYQQATHLNGSNHNANSNASSQFDPMSAPLPPPYDFSATGLVPILSLRGNASQTSMERSGTGNTHGVSASDPICID